MESGSSRPKLKFQKPSDEYSWEQDKVDIDGNSSTTFVFNPNPSLSLIQQRKSLPIASSQDHIIYLLEKYQTLVLVGETGSGKSTQIPQYLYEAGWTSEGNKIIGVTQPRRVAATSLAARVADEMGCNLGDEVGYSIRFDDKFNPARTKIKYMTEGILIREMLADPLLRQYSVIMLDEVHERSLNGDILMGLLRKILKKRKELRLVVSSATMDAEELQKYFDLSKESSKKKDKDREKRREQETATSVILSVSGRLYPVNVFYSSEPVADYVKESVEAVVKIHNDAGLRRGDILVFLTGAEEVDQAVSLVKQHKIQGKDTLELQVLPMYGTLPPRDQLKVFQYPPKGHRKVVFATNIAETSITVPGIAYVVDCGFVKMRWFNPDTFTDALVVTPVSKASAIQRAGRAGRTQPGSVYRLYSEEEYEKLPENTVPEIQRSDLASTVLQLKALGIDDIVHFHFPSPPPAKNLVCAVELLFALGALDKSGNLTSPLGEQMAEFPLSPSFSKMLLSSGEFGCSEEITAIVAMLQVESVFQTPHHGQAALRSRVEKRKFEVEEGDLITLWNVYSAFVQSKNSKQFCNQHFLHYKRLKRADELRTQTLKMLKRLGVPIVSAKGQLEPILKCICAGLFPNAVYLHFSGTYRTVRGDEPVHIHPTSVLYTLPQPQWLLFTEIIHTHQVHIRDLTVVDPKWLQELAPHFYRTVTERSNY